VILIQENHSTPIVSMCAYFKGGIRHENQSQNGITNFTQKVLLKGTEQFNAEEFAFRTEAIGSSMVTFTDKDAFGAHTSVLSKHLEQAFELFLDAIFHPTFPTEEAEKERQMILAEIEEGRDEIYSLCLELCDKTLFKDHPYRLPIKGEPETLSALGRDDLVGWHQKWYHPNNLIFSIVGDVQAERIAEKAFNYFEKIPKGKLPKFVAPTENIHGKREGAIELEKRQLAIALGFLAPPAADDSRFTFEVLNGVLSGMGSRLFIELRDKKGLAYSVGSRYEPVLDYGIMKTFMGTAANQEKAAKEGLIEELMKLRDFDVQEEELLRTKRFLVGLYEIGRQKNYTQAMRYARYEMLGLGWRVANLYPKKIESVEVGQIRELAVRYLDPENFSCAVVRPVKSSLEVSPSKT